MINSTDIQTFLPTQEGVSLSSGLFVRNNYESGEKLAKPAALEILRLPKPELEVLVAEEKLPAEPIANKKERGIDKDYLYFLSNPWDYFESVFEKHQLKSPISEIQKKIGEFKEDLPQVSSTSLMLMKSPFEHIRNLEAKRLAKRGISTDDIGKLLMSETQIIRPHSLDFAQNHETDNLNQFNLVLTKIVEDIFIIDSPIDGQIEHIATLSRYLSTLSEVMMYSSGNFKIDNPVLLDSIAEKIEFLIEKELTAKNKKQLKTLFDFLSYFEINNANACGIFLDLASKKGISHPLINEFRYQLNSKKHSEPERDNEHREKVGIEIEGSPIVLFKKLPEGFVFGVDGGYTMPELRKKDDSLYFDEEYKRQLFELWYWFKMGKFKGASIHLQIDDPDGQKMVIFQETLGFDNDSVRKNEKSSMRTVELRFNLSAYKIIDDDDTVFDISSPFVPEQYELADFIELILSIGENEDPEKIKAKIANLPDFWKGRLTKEVKKIDFKQFLQQAKRADWNWLEITTGINNLNEPLTIDQLVKIIKLGENYEAWNEEDVIEAAFDKLGEKLNFKQVMHVAEVSDWEDKIVELSLDALNEKLTLEQAIEISEESGWKLSLAEQAFSKIDRNLSVEEITALGDGANWDWRLISTALSKLDGILTLEQAIAISLKAQWDSDVVVIAFEKVGEKLTLEQILDIMSKFRTTPIAVSKLFTQLDGTLSFDQILSLSESHEKSWYLIAAALDKLEGTLTLKQVLTLNSKSGDSTTVTTRLLDKLDRMPNFKQATEFADNYYWQANITTRVFSKLDGPLNLAKILHVCNKCDWDIEIIKEIIKKLGEKLKPKQFIKLLEGSVWDAELFEAAIDTLNVESLTIEDVKLIVNSIPDDENKIIAWALFSQKDLKFPIFLHEMIEEDKDDEDDY